MERREMRAAMPAEIAERMSDVPFTEADEREQERTRMARIAERRLQLLNGDVCDTWAYQDHAHELVKLAHDQMRAGVSWECLGAFVKGWIDGNAQRQAERQVDGQ